MSNDFLGAGMAFPASLDADGRFRLASREDSIRQSIWTILSTSLGERAMRPAFGCSLHDHVFGVNGGATIGGLTVAVQDALTEWEPRIEVLSVDAVPDPARPDHLLIEISYQVRASNSRFNLVYPFYLGSAAG